LAFCRAAEQSENGRIGGSLIIERGGISQFFENDRPKQAELTSGNMSSSIYRSGDWVEVRTKEEILQTLGGSGRLDELPFMPSMFQFCGRQFRVFKRAHKTCDTVNDYKGRRMDNTVHLDGVRCDGKGYGSCEAACLIFWKEAWLKKIEKPGSMISQHYEPQTRSTVCGGCREEDVWAGTTAGDPWDAENPTYVCQATQVPAATRPLPWWDFRQYIEDYTSGNVEPARMARGFIYMGYNRLINSGLGLGRLLRWLYDVYQKLTGGIPYPRRHGKIPVGKGTPVGERLKLQTGEWVRVKSYQEILQTVDVHDKNRGLLFDGEMVPYCGKIFRVLKRVNRIVNEKTGKLLEFKNPCIILEGVTCGSRYSDCRLFCPRSIYPYWREIWLERVSGVGQTSRHDVADTDVSVGADIEITGQSKHGHAAEERVVAENKCNHVIV
jgi:hypothetical protein